MEKGFARNPGLSLFDEQIDGISKFRVSVVVWDGTILNSSEAARKLLDYALMVADRDGVSAILSSRT